MSDQKFYLHIGTHKTATTTIQKTVRKNRKQLLSEDGIKWIELQDFPRLKELMKLEAHSAAIEQELMGFIKAVTAGHKGDFLLSYEGLSGSPAGFYINNAFIAPILKTAFTGFQAEVIAMVRRQDEFIQSIFTQNFHANTYEASISEFYAEKDLNHLDWNTFIKPYVEAFGVENIHAFPYDRELLRDHSPLALINTVIGSNVLAGIDSLEDANVGFSDAARKISQDVRPYLNDWQNGQIRKGLQSVANKGKLSEYNILDQESKQKLIARFAPSNKAFFDKYIPKAYGMSGFSEPVFEKAEELSELESYKLLVVHLAGRLPEGKLPKHEKKISLTERLSKKMKSVIKHGSKR